MNIGYSGWNENGEDLTGPKSFDPMLTWPPHLPELCKFFILIFVLTAEGTHRGHHCHSCKRPGRRQGSGRRWSSGWWKGGALSSRSWSGWVVERALLNLTLAFKQKFGLNCGRSPFVDWVYSGWWPTGLVVGKWMAGFFLPSRRLHLHFWLESGLGSTSKDWSPKKNQPTVFYVANCQAQIKEFKTSHIKNTLFWTQPGQREQFCWFMGTYQTKSKLWYEA